MMQKPEDKIGYIVIFPTTMIQRPEDEIGYVVLFETSFLGPYGICVAPIRAAQIFSNKDAAKDAVYQQAQIHQYFKNIYDNKLFTVKPVRVTIIYEEDDD